MTELFEDCAVDETTVDYADMDVPIPVVYADLQTKGPEVGFVRTFKALPVTVAHGRGSFVWDTSGKRYLDMYSGHAVASTGHSHPHVVKAVADQAARLLFYSNVVDLEIRRLALEKLLSFISAENGITHALFANSGAEAIENAIKMAVHCTGRKKIVSFDGGFHGRTLLATNVTGNPKYRSQAPYTVDDVTFVPFGDIQRACAAIDGDTAAVLLEPVQSMAGCRIAGPEFYQALRHRTLEAGAMLIYDEIQTGIGRTGRMFFAGTHEVVPDIVCLAKGIASGIPMSAVLVSTAVADQIEYGLFGATYGAGPLAMAAMLATIEVIEQEGLLANVEHVGGFLRQNLKRHGSVRDVHGAGFLLGVRTLVQAKDVQARLLDRGVIVGTSDDPYVFRLLPPLVLSKAEASEFLAVFDQVMEELA